MFYGPDCTDRQLYVTFTLRYVDWCVYGLSHPTLYIWAFFKDILMKLGVRNAYGNYDMDAQSEHRMVRSGSRQYLRLRLRVKSLCRLHLTCGFVTFVWCEPGWLCRYGGRISVGGEIFPTLPDRPGGPPSLLYNGYRVFSGGKAAGVWRWPPIPQLSAEVEEK
jgi:hypothetical protein